MGAKESDLLQKINCSFPQDKWERIDYLDDKLEYETMSEVEHEELMGLIELYEEYSLQRLRQLGALATLRKITLDELVEQLGIAPKHHATY